MNKLSTELHVLPYPWRSIGLYSLLVIIFLLLTSMLVSAAPPPSPLSQEGPLCETPPTPPSGDEDIAIRCEKYTNGSDANAVDGSDAPEIAIGAPILWEYFIHNSGDMRLSHLVVTDDQGVTVRCPKDSLNDGEAMTCTARGVATDLGGQIYENWAFVSGKNGDGKEAHAQCVSHYRNPPCQPAIDLEQFTNGEDADEPTGPAIDVGAPVVWIFQVRNTGQDPLQQVIVTDNRLGPICEIANLGVGESQSCTKTGVAEAGQFANLSTVTAQSRCGVVRDEDACHYVGRTCEPAIDLEQLTNGFDADVAPGPNLTVGEPVTWSFIVRNTGKEALQNVTVTDDRLGQICVIGDLVVGASQSCTKSGVAEAGQFANRSTVTGESRCGVVRDEDACHYLGYQLGIDLEKACNSQDADTPPGPALPIGGAITWSYVVRNTGTLPLHNLVVTDDKLDQICTIERLGVGETQQCTRGGTALEGQSYANLGTVIAYAEGVGNTLSRIEARVEDSDPSHCYAPSTGAALTMGKEASYTWTYWVRNAGEADLTNLTALLPDGVSLAPPPDPTGVLSAGNSWRFDALGAYLNCAQSFSMNATTLDGSEQVTAQVASIPMPHNLQLAVTVNGQTAEQPDDLAVVMGTPVTWRYQITNGTGVDLTNVQLYAATMDSASAYTAVTCPQNSLATNATMECTVTGDAQAGPISTVGYVEASALGHDVAAGAISHYLGVAQLMAQVQGRVFHDLYLTSLTEVNGIQDPDEPGVAGITVQLYAEDGATPVAEVTSDAQGAYLLEALPGRYYLRFVQPGADPSLWRTWSQADQPVRGYGVNECLDSDPVAEGSSNGQSARTSVFTLARGTVDESWDAGLVSSIYARAVYLPCVNR